MWLMLSRLLLSMRQDRMARDRQSNRSKNRKERFAEDTNDRGCGKMTYKGSSSHTTETKNLRWTVRVFTWIPPKSNLLKKGASPKTATEIHHFLDFAGYYQRFIEGFPKIAKSIAKLTQKKIKFDWSDKAEAAFQLIKQKLCSAPILALPEGNEDFIAYCDASIKGRSSIALKLWMALSLCGTKIVHVHCTTKVCYTISTEGLNMRQRTGTSKAHYEFGPVMDYRLDLPSGILDTEAQIEARRKKPENLKSEGRRRYVMRIRGPGKAQGREKLEPLEDGILFTRGCDKNVQDRSNLLVPNMNADIATYVSKCLTCLRVQSSETPNHWLSGQASKMLLERSGHKAWDTSLDHLRSEYGITIPEDWMDKVKGPFKTLEDMFRACVINFGNGWEGCMDMSNIARKQSKKRAKTDTRTDE
ncbi:putative reverse transcriptase domain-containing protein [Tanacetum coccineum]